MHSRPRSERAEATAAAESLKDAFIRRAMLFTDSDKQAALQPPRAPVVLFTSQRSGSAHFRQRAHMLLAARPLATKAQTQTSQPTAIAARYRRACPLGPRLADRHAAQRKNLGLSKPRMRWVSASRG